jgi:hypothetical protein
MKRARTLYLAAAAAAVLAAGARAEVKSIEEGGGPQRPPLIRPVDVYPEKAKEAYADAEAAVKANDWVKAGGLLEGLLALDERAFDEKKRLAAARVLVTCHLKNQDAGGAARNLVKTAGLVKDETAKRHILAAAEALRAAGGPRIGQTNVQTFAEALEAARTWKAEQIFVEARRTGTRGQMLDNMDYVEKNIGFVLKKLEEADAYVAGFSASRRTAALGGVVENILEGSKAALAVCTAVREGLAKDRIISMTSRARAGAWNDRARAMFGRRQAAMDALANLATVSGKYDLGSLYNESERQNLVSQLDDLQYYPGTQVKIELRIVGSHRGYHGLP